MADHREVLARFQRYRETEDRELRNQLVEEHRWIAVHSARRFAKRGEPLDDLLQVAMLGVFKAVQRFDPTRGVSFPTFATPTVLGELRRHFRDTTWAVRVPRRAKDLHVTLSAAVDRLSQELQRPPTVPELAADLHLSTDEVLEVLEASAAYRTSSLSVPRERGDDDELGEDGVTLGADDPQFEHADDRHHVDVLLQSLSEREREIVRLRFFEGLTQSEIAGIVGVSQVHVSRLLRASLDRLRSIEEAC